MRVVSLAVAAALAALGLTLALSGGASAQGDSTATVEMLFTKQKHSYFTGPKTIKQGATLRVLNATTPDEEGPHTFSLVQEPLSKSEVKACLKKKPCDLVNKVISEQKVVFKGKNDVVVHKKSVDVGKTGWDTGFGNKGDTWYTDDKGQSESRKVTAPVGSTIYYFCAVHAFMQGEIKVVK